MLSKPSLFPLKHTRERLTAMSTSSRTPERRQQTVFDVSASRLIREFPDGIILRYESNNDQLREFIVGNVLITYVVFNFSDAREIIEEHGSLHTFLSDWQVPIVTATEADELLEDRQRDDIRWLLKRIQPAIYIPDAGKVYGNNERYKQRGGLHEYRIRVDWVLGEIERQGWEVEVLPLAKAMYRWQFKEMLPWYRKHGFQNFAYYTRQYYSDGNRFHDLRDHIWNLINIVDPDNIHVIGLHGGAHLRKLPSRVNGASGLKQFLTRCSFENRSFTDWRTGLEVDSLYAKKLGDY
jgi:hypothetical protein